MNIILLTIWFLMPAFFANMAPIFVNKIFNNKGRPINIKLFGAHKTYRGFISGIILSGIMIALQVYLYQYYFFKNLSLLDYGKINWIIYGLLFGLGSMLGDLIKSFFKRRLGIKPGLMFIPFDQIDYILGSFILLSLVYFPGWIIFLLSLIISFFANILVNYLGYLLNFRDTKI
jgi:CDP-2,3-bis-(O-geranylgeranyl)-sn-glycerol synthase